MGTQWADVAIAQPWLVAAMVTAACSAVSGFVRATVWRRGAPADTSMAWRGMANGGGWRVDPSGRHAHRFHDGAGWTVLVVTRDGRTVCDRLD